MLESFFNKNFMLDFEYDFVNVCTLQVAPFSIEKP